MRDSVLGHSYADQARIKGVEQDDSGVKERIYQQYLEAYQVGVFNFIRAEKDPLGDGPIPRKYFSGGILPREAAMISLDL